MSRATPAHALPSVAQQKSFIVTNASILNLETRSSILKIVMQEIGESVILKTAGRAEVNVNLDAVAEKNEEVLGHIYNIVRARLDVLSQPAQFSSDPADSARH
jgi:hypothetical protein